jgi:hypothetical protein
VQVTCWEIPMWRILNLPWLPWYVGNQHDRTLKPATQTHGAILCEDFAHTDRCQTTCPSKDHWPQTTVTPLPPIHINFLLLAMKLVRPIYYLFQCQDCTCLLASLITDQSLFPSGSVVKKLLWESKCFSSF